MTKLIYKPNSMLGGFTLFDEMFDDFFKHDRYYPTNQSSNITENDDNIKLTIDVPGFKKSEISIHYENDILQIVAKKEEDTNRSSVNKSYQVANINIKNQPQILKMVY